jgi:hypothetical protein
MNDVLSELMQGPLAINPTQLGQFLNHILNSEASMDHKRKEKRFLIEENGEVKYVVLNAVSAIDFGQILLCQNHLELIVVSNDREMIKSAAQLLHKRVMGMPAMLNKLLELYPENEILKVLQKTGEEIFSQKHAFGQINNSFKK